MTQATETRTLARVRGGRIYVQSPYSPANVERSKSIPGGRWDKDSKSWHYPATAHAAALLRDLWKPVTGMVADGAFRELLQAAEQLETVAAHKTAADLPGIPSLNKPGWLHQRQAYWFAEKLPATMLAMAMGTGKSLVAVGLIATYVQQELAAGNLPPLSVIICPLSVVSAWAGSDLPDGRHRPGQFEQHCTMPFLVAGLNKGSVADKVKRVDAAIRQGQREGRPVVIVVNYDSAREDPMAAYLLRLKIGYLVMDESHRLKAPGGKTAKFAESIAKKAARRIALTGTPMPHDPLDVYAQYRALDPSIYGTNFARFRNRYAVMGGYGNYQVVDFQRTDELNRLFYTIAYKADASVLDLPEKNHVYRFFSLSPKAQRAYDALSEKLVAELDEGIVTAANALVKLLRVAQITSGYLPYEVSNVAPVDYDGVIMDPLLAEQHPTLVQGWIPDPDLTAFGPGKKGLARVDEGKENELEDVLSDLDSREPVVVFCRFQTDLDLVHAVAKKLGRGSAELSGRQHELETWQADTTGACPILAVQLQSGGVGIDLTRAAYAVYFSKDFSLGNYDQSLARLHRPGQTRSVTYIHLMASGTVDEKIMVALEERRNVVEAVLEEMGAKKERVATLGRRN